MKQYGTTVRALTMFMSLTAVMAFFIPAVLFFGADTETVLADLSDCTEAAAPKSIRTPRVVLDAGHGGEDGGAVSADGVMEKTLNLSIVLTLGDMLEAAGIPVVYTRTDDNGLYDGAVPGHRKMTDLKNRLAVWEQYPDAILVSVHMNTFSAARYHGMQVFYGVQSEESALLAETIRQNNQNYLQPDNTRACKPAGSSIYLLDRCRGSAVLVECGFLSNPDEAALLSEASYREKIAAVLCASILAHFAEP
ncbi:MAG: N-acetylmuramoyl-L-alanine amidase [Eubacteriales bacterium]